MWFRIVVCGTIKVPPIRLWAVRADAVPYSSEGSSSWHTAGAQCAPSAGISVQAVLNLEPVILMDYA